MSTRTLSRSLAGALAVLGAGACVLTSPTAASAHASMPSAPTGLRVVKVSPSSFTVRASGSARQFRLYAAKTRRELAVERINGAAKSGTAPSPTLTLKGLKYSTTPYFYRVVAMNGSRRRFSAIQGTIALQPQTPTNLQATSSASGLSLSWDSAPATGFTVTQATDSAMTKDVKTYTIDNDDATFTPYGLDEGATYYFTVAALNGTTPSAPTVSVSAECKSEQLPVSFMTYNVKEATLDGEAEGGNNVAPWSQRRIGVANYINSASPDVVGVQEAAALVNGKTRQIDDLVTALGGTYSLAQTEIAPTQPGHTGRTGVYILYKTSTYAAVGDGGHWSLGDSRWAAYQELQNKATGAKFLFVSPHLQVTGQPNGTDQGREDEDMRMVSQANDYAASLGGVPIIYAGDFNSDPSKKHDFNGPSDYNLAHGLSDSYDVAQTRTNAEFNTANGYQTTPMEDGYRLDYLFVTPGVAVTHWGQLLDLDHGQFVGPIPSDHNPVVADMLIPYQPAS
jgi:endonuclease/exonuclease/phosphatase family metal-dependent hydrolase